jgi:hypothetical protein
VGSPESPSSERRDHGDVGDHARSRRLFTPDQNACHQLAAFMSRIAEYNEKGLCLRFRICFACPMFESSGIDQRSRKPKAFFLPLMPG